MLCPYCGSEKPDTEATDEHVFPKALGGNLIPTNPFLLKTVCQRCNSASGRWIDGLFIRSWLTQNKRAENAIRYFDLNCNPVLPLSYMGELQEEFLTNKVCDVWLGPTGDMIYHFHAPYPKKDGAGGMIGRPLYLRDNEVDPGFVFLFIRATNPEWHKPIYLSVIDHFKDSTVYLGNDSRYIVNIPHELNTLHNRLLNNLDNKHEVKFPISGDFGDRFLAKLALGLGALFLDNKFVESVDAKNLRNFMWAKNYNDRANINIGCVPFLSGILRPETLRFLCWEAGHVILLLPIGNELFLIPILYGNLVAEIVISSDPSLWNGRIDRNGIVYVIAPGLRRYVGPVSLPHYLAVTTNTIEDSDKLSELFRLIDSLGEPPPYDLSQSGD